MRKTQAATPHEASREKLLRLSDGSRPRVLLAEDSTAARILTAALLKRMGCNVDVVEHGEEAVCLAQSFPYDLIILDIEMPVMDGVMAAREIRALGGAAGRTPIVALSALLADARKLNAWKDAFDAMLAKPAGREQLRKAVADILSLRGGASNSTLSADPDLLVDLQALGAIRARIGPDECQGLLEMAVREMRDLAAAMRAAEERNDRRGMGRGTHKLKGIARTFAAPRLASLAEELETSLADRPRSELTEQIEEITHCVQATAIAFSAAAAA